jgi:hypothetical protein
MSDAPTPPTELAIVLRWLSRNSGPVPSPERVPRYLSREWFDEWLSEHADGCVFIDERFDETELRDCLLKAERERDRDRMMDVGSWLIMLLRRHGRDVEADALMNRIAPEKKKQAGRKPERQSKEQTQRLLFETTS